MGKPNESIGLRRKQMMLLHFEPSSPEMLTTNSTSHGLE
jgi:hypothetical protein